VVEVVVDDVVEVVDDVVEVGAAVVTGMVVLVVVVGGHLYLYRRMFRDTTDDRRIRRVGAVALGLAAASLFLARSLFSRVHTAWGDALAFAARQRRERLAQPQVAETNVGHALQNRVRGRRVRFAGTEKLEGVSHRQIEHFGNVLPGEQVLEH